MKKILIIEDESVQQQAYRLKLEKKYQLAFATTANEVLSNLSPTPDLIILDVMLPGGKNGFDILQTLKESPKTSNIPVIMLTNLGEDEKQTALDCGATDYFTKTSTSLGKLENIIEKYI
ncbi:MAG: response regulator [bacterium]